MQGAVLITGLAYIIIGILLYVSPLWVLKFFVENISENWLDLVRDNELVAPLYNITRGFSALLFTSGFAMIMPLFDPLKYRGLIFYNGLVFPLFSSIIFIYSIISGKKGGSNVARASVESSGQEVHSIIVILGIVFLCIMIINAIGLIMTKKEAREGTE